MLKAYKYIWDPQRTSSILNTAAISAMLILLPLFFHFFVGCTQAQFIQRWLWRNAPDADGNMVPTPFWHREAHLPPRPVLFPRSDIMLEYNCHKLPAICQNVRNWEADSSKSQWNNRRVGWFTLDIGSSSKQRWPGFPGNKTPTIANIRRHEQYPGDWKGMVISPKCPQPNQPDVVPAWVDGSGNGIRAIVPQDLSDLTKSAYLEIMYKQSDPQNPLTRRRSGRVYSCDEFPPASWVEGGVGTAGYVYIPMHIKLHTSHM